MTLALLVGIAQFSLGLFAENAGEWLFHRFVLHGLGNRPESVWSYHLHDHHRVARNNHMVDPGYRESPFRWNTQGKELLFLSLVVLLHVPWLPYFPFYVAGMLSGIVLYYMRHRRAHLDPDWARAHLPWHYEHHLGEQRDANWCVSWPWFDCLMGTRIPSIPGDESRPAKNSRPR